MPLARTKRDDPTFTKADAYALVGRLAASWGYLTNEPGREDILAQEYLAQFDGYDPAKVHQAVTNAIGKARGEPPSAGEIKAELKALVQPLRASDRHGYRPWYDYSVLPDHIRNAPDHPLFGSARKLMSQGCSPDYILWREKDRALMCETVAKINAMSPERYAELRGGFGATPGPKPMRPPKAEAQRVAVKEAA